MLRLIAFLLLVPSVCLAGAWPREKGTGFASASVRLVWPQSLVSAQPESTYVTLFSEYGLTDRLTIGTDLGHSVSGDSKAIAFLRIPLTAPSNWAAATELGLGQISGEPVFRPTVSLGRGVEGRFGNGWINVDLTVEFGLSSARFDTKLDATFGVKMAQDRLLILQIQSGQPSGKTAFLRLAPSVVFPIRGNLRAEVGGTLGVKGENSVGLLMGLWHDF